MIANGGAARCVDSSTGLPNTTSAVGADANAVTSQTTTAQTTIEPDSGPAAAQSVSAVGRVEQLNVNLAPAPPPAAFGVGTATARATGACAAGAPQLAGTSESVNLTVNGTVVANDQFAARLNETLLPRGQVATVVFNEQVRGASSLTQRAVHITIRAGSTPVYELVAGEATTGFSGAVCADTGAGGGNTDGGGTLGSLRACPNGAELAVDSGLCVIRRADSSVIIVGRPFEGPSGGSVIALDEARKRYRSECLQGDGPNFVVIGTDKNDRVTGTNKRDRMLLLAGSDRGDGGRGDDCIDGGSGRDVLSGALGNDKVLGTTGNDSLNGGAGNDTLSGGSGNDTINAAYGRDVVSGGSGRDFINVATAGPVARVNCGSGADKVRVNYNERRATRGCETRYVLRDRKSLQPKKS